MNNDLLHNLAYLYMYAGIFLLTTLRWLGVLHIKWWQKLVSRIIVFFGTFKLLGWLWSLGGITSSQLWWITAGLIFLWIVTWMYEQTQEGKR